MLEMTHLAQYFNGQFDAMVLVQLPLALQWISRLLGLRQRHAQPLHLHKVCYRSEWSRCSQRFLNLEEDGERDTEDFDKAVAMRRNEEVPLLYPRTLRDIRSSDLAISLNGSAKRPALVETPQDHGRGLPSRHSWYKCTSQLMEGFRSNDDSIPLHISQNQQQSIGN